MKVAGAGGAAVREIDRCCGHHEPCTRFLQEVSMNRYLKTVRRGQQRRDDSERSLFQWWEHKARTRRERSLKHSPR